MTSLGGLRKGIPPREAFRGEVKQAAANSALPVLQKLFTSLRGLYFIHWTAHWQAAGADSYSDHLLFQRMYGAIADEIDGLAEKMVASYGAKAVSLSAGVAMMAKDLAWFDSDSSPVAAKCLKAEKDLQIELKLAYDALKSSGMSLGMDNFLQGIADAHETNIYLLTQRVR